MSFTKSKEMYVKEIYRLSQHDACVRATDVARRLRVSKASVTRATKILAKEGYITHTPYEHIALTPDGVKKGVELCERQETLTAYLMTTLLIDRQTAFDEACRLEHVISPHILHRINERLSERPENKGLDQPDKGVYHGRFD